MMLRTVAVDEDGYLIEIDEESSSPILCWADGSRLCCDCCAAFRIEIHLDGESGTTRDTEFVHCIALGDRGAAIGRIDGSEDNK